MIFNTMLSLSLVPTPWQRRLGEVSFGGLVSNDVFAAEVGIDL